MIPPQVSPTANASSSENPYRCSSACPESSTRRAVSYTSPSTQPPETDPLTVPSPATSIAAPGSRGADLNACTTVASPARSEEHTSELQSRGHLVCRLLLEKKNQPTVDTCQERETRNCRA